MRREGRTFTTTPKLLRRLVLLVGAVGALTLGIAAPASAEWSDPASCFGDRASTAASSAPRVVRNFVSHNATEVWDPPETSTGQTGAGKTPPNFGGDPAPWVGNVDPFLVPNVEMLRSEGPNALKSAAYAEDYNEVKKVGSLGSTKRTADQTAASIFWGLKVNCGG